MSGNATYYTDLAKIDSLAVNGLSGTADSLAYKVHEIEKHFHNSIQMYGLTANTMARKSTSPIVVTGGSDAWGTELELHNGSTIESGSSTKKFDLSQLYVTIVGTANRVTYLEFYANTLGTPVTTVATTAGTDLFTKVGHGFVNTDKVMISSIVTTTGINVYTVYYVVGVVGNDFQVALTSGGAAVDLQTGDGTCTVTKITQTLLTETVVSKANANADVLVQPVLCPRQTCNTRISCRGWAAAGTNAISFFIGLHTYSA